MIQWQLTNKQTKKEREREKTFFYLMNYSGIVSLSSFVPITDRPVVLFLYTLRFCKRQRQ
jgi:hypothetical protein